MMFWIYSILLKLFWKMVIMLDGWGCLNKILILPNNILSTQTFNLGKRGLIIYCMKQRMGS
jgi:hypothetical protein